MTYIEAAVIKMMTEDAIHTFPDECCGFLFGKETNEERVILQTAAVNNAKEGDKRRRFEIKPKDYLEAERYADEQGWLLLGVYHSHPNHPAIPSEHDRLAAQPYFSYIILSVINKEYAGLRSWRLNDEQQFEEEKIYDHQLTLKK
ncbi:MAG: M67 family metallopeptidase [Bacteroidota bacterium]|nr:M67 family metallopeptidase [Bacteroidota bacterium]